MRRGQGLAALAILLSLTASAGTRIREAGSRIRHERLAASAGGAHTCFVLDDGTVRCWGANASGQLGDGSTVNLRSQPVTVTGLFTAVEVSVGMDFSCALLGGTGGAGSVRCWGNNFEFYSGERNRAFRRDPDLLGNGSHLRAAR